MEWLAARLNQNAKLETPNLSVARNRRRKITNRTTDALCIGSSNCSICQIFPESKTRCGRMQKGELRYAADQAYLEEKMWFALFLASAAARILRRELGDKYFIKLQEIIPYSWLLDQLPFPQHQSFRVWKFTTGRELRSSARKIAIFF